MQIWFNFPFITGKFLYQNVEAYTEEVKMKCYELSWIFKSFKFRVIFNF